jgi:hypothetical protein
MAQRFLHESAVDRFIGYPTIGVANTQFSKADAVYIDSSGYLALATTSSQIVGFCLEDKTTASTNATVELYCPQYVDAMMNIYMAYPSDQDCTQTDIGAWCDFGSVTTGAMTLNLAASSKAQFLVRGFDPNNEADDDDVVVTCAEPQQYGSSQA